QPATARLNGSVGDSFEVAFGLVLEDIVSLGVIAGHRSLKTGVNALMPGNPSFLAKTMDARGQPAHDELNSAQSHIHRALRQLHAEAPLVELGDDRTLELVALVQERH